MTTIEAQLIEQIKKLPPSSVAALSVGVDALVFELEERNPVDHLPSQFEAVGQLPPEVQSVVMEVLESRIIKYQTRRWHKRRSSMLCASS